MKRIEEYSFYFSKDTKPVATVEEGEELLFVTQDCYEGQITDEETSTRFKVDLTHTNPSTGPVAVEGAMPGDVLAVEILDIEVAERGVIVTIENCGALWSTCELRTKFVPIQDGYAFLNDVKFPIEPMIGVIGTAPSGEDVPTGYSFYGGGNMDNRLITKGTCVYLPVNVPGGLLSIGDIHAAMGDGEVSGTGVEIAAKVTVRVRLIKDFKLNWPVTETEDCFYVNTCGINCNVAIKRGYEELQRLVMQAYGWDATDTTLYLSAQARLSANQAVLNDHSCDEAGATFRVGVPKLETKPRIIG